MSTSSHDFVFRHSDSVGLPEAELDAEYLASCFVDNGCLAALRDCQDPRCIVVGRTGSGKTALLQQIESKDRRVIRLDPEGLALEYVSNNDLIQRLSDSGVRFELFFRYLWRHILAIELLESRFQPSGSIVSQIQTQVARLNRRHAEGLKYLENWGSEFWIDTETRVKALTKWSIAHPEQPGHRPRYDCNRSKQSPRLPRPVLR